MNFVFVSLKRNFSAKLQEHSPMLSTKMPNPSIKNRPNTQKRNIMVRNCSGSIHRTSENGEIKYLKKQEWLRLLESVDNYRDKLIVKLLYSTGMRVGELTRLKVEDIDFHERFIHIPAENTKTNTARTVIVPKEVLSDVSAYLSAFRNTSRTRRNAPRINNHPLFNLHRSVESSKSSRNTLKRANIEASPHTLRHTHIVHALLDRIPITAVQKQVGHKKLTTTQIYSNLAPEQVREAYEKVGN